MSRFNQYQDRPFLANETEFNQNNAIWLAEFSSLAYENQDRVRSEISGVTGAPFTVSAWISRGSTQCFVIVSDEAVIVAFRGTENPKKIFKLLSDKDLRGAWKTFFDVFPDVLVDGNVRMQNLGDDERGTPLGSVHAGFNSALKLVWSEVDIAIRKEMEANPDRKLWFTGHSLGAALATLAAFRHPPSGGVYTFGSPRVGDRVFSDAFKGRVPVSYRVRNDQDIVTRLPTSPARLDEGLRFPGFSAGLPVYAHVEFLKFLDEAGRLQEPPPVDAMLESWAFLLQIMGRGARPPISHELLADHDIDQYVEKIVALT